MRKFKVHWVGTDKEVGAPVPCEEGGWGGEYLTMRVGYARHTIGPDV